MRIPTLLRAAVLAAFLPLGRTGAQGLAAVGPTSPDHGFPDWYEDHNGLRLDLCLTDPVLCLLEGGAVTLTNPGAPFPANYGGTFPDEAFWNACEALMPTNNGGQALLVIALEAAFGNEIPEAGQQVSFARVRVRVDNLIAGASYTVTTPVGVFNFVATGSGTRGINFTDDVGIVPGMFTGALGGALGPFLMWDSDLPILDASGREYIGNPAVDHTITGSPFGTNFFRIEGPSVGGPGVNSIETNLFAVLGLKTQAIVPAVPVAAFTSAPNSGTAPLNVSFTDLSTGTVTARLWNFGDGATSTLQNPSHVYAPGTYTVSLTVSGPGGMDTETKPGLIVVANAPPGPQLVLANPVPGTAGVANRWVVTGATPNRFVGVYTGMQLGGSIVNLGSCGGIPIGLNNPFRLIGKAKANAAGVATITGTPPATSAGKLFHFQAVEPASCRTSNIVSNVL
jgi:PKD repeat protein